MRGAAPSKRDPTMAPTTTCAAATSQTGGRDWVMPMACTMALSTIGPTSA